MAIRTPRRQWKGLERQLLRKLQSSLLSIQSRDDRASQLAAEKQTSPYLFAQDGQDPVFVAMQTIMTRIDGCLIAMA